MRKHVERINLEKVNYVKENLQCPYCNGGLYKHSCYFDRGEEAWLHSFQCRDCGSGIGPLPTDFLVEHTRRFLEFEEWKGDMEYAGLLEQADRHG